MNSRKFILAVTTLIFAGTLEMYCGGISEGFIYIVAIINGIYTTGNVGSKLANSLPKTPK